MKGRLTNWQVALVAWLLATLVVVLVYGAYVWVTGGSIRWPTLGRAAVIALVYAAYLGWRFRRRSEQDH